jgi:hypothetical protein
MMIKSNRTSTVLRFLRLLFLYCLIVTGGTTLFLIIAPIIGYLPYSDRPGSGWLGMFAGLFQDAFWSTMKFAIGTGIFMLLVIVCPGAIITTIMLWLEHIHVKPVILRTIGGILGGLVAVYTVLAISWYIAADILLLVMMVLLGAVAGVTVLPHKNVTRAAFNRGS